MTDEILGTDPIQQLLNDADLAGDERLAAVLADYRTSMTAEPPAPSPEVAELMSASGRSRIRWLGTPGARTTTVVVLIAALAGGASAAAAASPAFHAMVRGAFSSLSPAEHAARPVEHPTSTTPEPARDGASGTPGEAARPGHGTPRQATNSGTSGLAPSTTDDAGSAEARTSETKGAPGAADTSEGHGAHDTEAPHPDEHPEPTQAPGAAHTADPQPATPGKPGPQETSPSPEPSADAGSDTVHD